MPPKMTGIPLAPEMVGDLPAALDLAGEHAGDGNEVDLFVEVYVLHVLVGEYKIACRPARWPRNRSDRGEEDGIPSVVPVWAISDK